MSMTGFDFVAAAKMLKAEIAAVSAELKVLVARAEFALAAAQKLEARSQSAAGKTDERNHVN
jgi:hypothetical protein